MMRYHYRSSHLLSDFVSNLTHHFMDDDDKVNFFVGNNAKVKITPDIANTHSLTAEKHSYYHSDSLTEKSAFQNIHPCPFENSRCHLLSCYLKHSCLGNKNIVVISYYIRGKLSL